MTSPDGWSSGTPNTGWGDMGDMANAYGTEILGVKQQVEDQGELIQVYGQQLIDLENVTRTGVTTPSYASAGGRDLISFPDAMMQIVDTYTDTGNWDSTVPAYNPDKRAAEFAFMRGGLDRATPLQVLRIITGSDSGLFGIDAWYLGIYGYDQPNNRMLKIWDSGDIKAILVDQRKRYHIATGLNLMAEPDQLFAVASLQIAPGLAQKTRGHGAIKLTNISEQAGTVPQARHARLGNQSSLPAAVSMSAFEYDKRRLMWAALGASTS
ncbi:hypothetical protein QM716_15655 [Rhodococcus sp. IEGM 1409]|uniref:hypothetical protein n=1 Tax=Rhodococcus sp. IEGM 1409 TaxID=3047082 RepID=UPI0024B6FB4F|nr:hypothetical protein [Rhodococcus sp. IEGM 1409]MDI9901294.1 hypothetical protein [Rhodococcus sp. IEGM 1409]